MYKVIKSGTDSKFKTLCEAQNAAGVFGVVFEKIKGNWIQIDC